jgi:hypothetical protein
MKYLVVKALLGFGDRLESLKMCVDYALKYNLKLYIDWSDNTWKEGFYRYFSLDVDMFTPDEITDSETVYPEYWKGKLNETLTFEPYNSRIAELDVGNLITPLPYDVIVTVCSGIRTVYNDSFFFANRFRVIDTRIIEEVKRRRSVYNLEDKWGIHLRGTDRASSLAYKQRRMSELTIKLVSQGLFNGAKIVVVSDDKEYIDIWKQRFPDFPIITNISESPGITPKHLIESESKDQNNVELLIDFFTLASCQRIYSTSPDSRFAREASRLGRYIHQII